MARTSISPLSIFSVTHEGKTLLSKLVNNNKAHSAVPNNEALHEESVEVLPEEWNLEPDEFLLVTQYLRRYSTHGAWFIVENSLSSLKQQLKQGICSFVYLFMFHS